MFRTIVAAQTSYTFNEIIDDAKFEMMNHEETNRKKTYWKSIN